MKNQGWIAFDQWINALIFRGWADETISARAYRGAAQGKRKWEIIQRIINGLFFWQKDHCRASFEMEINRSHMPAAYRTIYNAEGVE